MVDSKYKVPIILFYIFASILIYIKSFLIFYTIAVIINCISIYQIKTLYEELDGKEKNIYDKVNEVRIDYIISHLGVGRDEFIGDIEQVIKSSNYSDNEKSELLNYINERYM